MISRLITKSKTIRRQSRQFFINSSTKCEHLANKYQLIKRFLILGTLTNLYFCYNSFVRLSIYNEISTGINNKFNEWSQNQIKNKEMIFELMKEMEIMKSQKRADNIQKQNITSSVVQANAKQNKQQQTKDKKEEKSSSSFFSFFKGSKDKGNQKKDEYI